MKRGKNCSAAFHKTRKALQRLERKLLMSDRKRTAFETNDNDDGSYQSDGDELRSTGEMPPLVIKRPRHIRTENTPVAADDYSQPRVASPPIRADAAYLSTGIRAGQASIQVDAFDHYQREDGLKGEVGKADSTDAFNLTYMREYARRIELLEKDPDNHFANLVRGFLGGDVFEIIERDAFERQISQSISRAKEEARKALSRGDSIDQLRKEIAEREKQNAQIDGKINAVEERQRSWTVARRELDLEKQKANNLLKNNADLSAQTSEASVKQILKLRINKDPEILFDVMGRVAFIKYGQAGLLNEGFATDVESAFRSVAGKRFGSVEALKNAAPQVYELSLYAAVLKGLVNSRGLLSAVSSRIKFNAGSEYEKSSELFATDVTALCSMIIRDTDSASQSLNKVLFEQITLVFYAHLNKMASRYGLPEDQRVSKPLSQLPLEKKRGSAKKTILGVPVDVDVDDSELQRAAVGEKTSFTEKELAEYRKQLFDNAEAGKTRSIVALFLRPLFVKGFSALFFVEGQSEAVKDRLYRESRYPFDEPLLARTVFSRADLSETEEQSTTVAAIFSLATLLLEQTKPNPATGASINEVKSAIFKELYDKNSATSDWLRYENNLRNSVVRRTILPAVARLLLAANENLKLLDQKIVFTKEEVRALEDLVSLPGDATTERRNAVENVALEVYDRRLPSDGADPDKLEGVLRTASNRSFENLINSAGERPFKVDASLTETKKKVENGLELYKTKLDKILSQTPKEVEADILENFKEVAGVTRRQASLPENSGIIVLSSRFKSALGDATNVVRNSCPNLVELSDEMLQRHEKTCVSFAKLVASKILIVTVLNPPNWMRDKMRTDIKVEFFLNAVQELKRVDLGSSRSSSHRPGFGQLLSSGQKFVPLQTGPCNGSYGGYFN